MRVLSVLALVLSMLSVVGAQEETGFVPLAEVTPGLEGYGIGPLNGQDRSRFYFRVVSVDHAGSGLYPLIVVELFSHPTLRPEPGLVISGMSGSPLYVGERLLGAVSRAPSFPMDSKGYVLPAELLSLFRPVTLAESEPYLEPGQLHAWKPGDSYVYCSVWGDVNRCGGATITSTGADGLVRAQGHLIRSWNNDGDGSKTDKKRVPTGPLAMPVWKAQLFGKIPMISISSVISEPSGPVVGALVWNGEYGHLIRRDRRPLGITVGATMSGSRDLPVRRIFQVAYSVQSVTEIMESIKDISQLEFGDARPLMLRASVKVRGIEEEFHVQDAFINWGVASKNEDYGALDGLLNWILLWTYPRPIIETVDVEVFPTNAELYEPKSYRATVGADGTMSVEVNIRRERDYTMFNKTVSRPKVEGASAYVLVTGNWIQRTVLASLPLAQAPAAFNAVDDSAALYFAATTTVAGVVKESTSSPEGWTREAHRVDVRILAKLTGDGTVISVKDDEATSVELVKKE